MEELKEKILEEREKKQTILLWLGIIILLVVSTLIGVFAITKAFEPDVIGINPALIIEGKVKICNEEPEDSETKECSNVFNKCMEKCKNLGKDKYYCNYECSGYELRCCYREI